MNEENDTPPQPSWMDSLFLLFERDILQSEEFRSRLHDSIVIPIAQSAMRVMLPYFTSLIVLLALTVILLGVVLWYIVNYRIEKPIEFDMTFLDDSVHIM